MIASLFAVSCKSDSSSSSSTTPTATPLQGTWRDGTSNQTMLFSGSNMTVTQPELPNPYDFSISNVTMVVTGTFRVDGGNLYFTPTSITATIGTTPMTQAELDAYLVGNPMTVNNEILWGTYAVSGNTLTINETGVSTPNTYTKQ